MDHWLVSIVVNTHRCKQINSRSSGVPQQSISRHRVRSAAPMYARLHLIIKRLLAGGSRSARSDRVRPDPDRMLTAGEWVGTLPGINWLLALLIASALHL